METRLLGRTALTVSALGFGCGAVGGLMVRGAADDQRQAVARAIEAGIRYFDTAPSYGDGRSEENLGRVLQELGQDARDLVVGTKVRVPAELFAAPGSAQVVARTVRESIEASLRRLRRERVHLLQLHNRITAGADGAQGEGLTPAQVTGPVAEAMRAVQEAGLTEFAGITGTGEAPAVEQVLGAGVADTAQLYFNALNPSAGWPGSAPEGEADFAGLIDSAARQNVGVIVIRPLAAGAVSASSQRHANAGSPGTGTGIAGERFSGDVARAQALVALAGELGLEGPVELALRFAMAKPGVSTVLVGYSDGEQLASAIRWAARGPLPEDAVRRVLAIHRPA
jgi:aryl-alcohol dehydrogenase-like predicted oxidoreductase